MWKILLPATAFLHLIGEAVLTIGTSSEASTPPTCTVPLIRQPPAIDAELSDPCWGKAAAIRKWYLAEPGASRACDAAHRAWLCADNEWLYVAFMVAHPHPSRIRPDVQERDGRVQIEDCVKVLFDPGTEFRSWCHFRLSAGNTQSDQRNSPTEGYVTSWNIPWRSATRITDRGWQAEMAFPLALMQEKRAKTQTAPARLNLLVHSIVPVLGEKGELVNEHRRLHSWAPVTRRFWQDTERFGFVRGLRGLAIRTPFLPFFTVPEVTGYQLEDGQRFYEVHTRIKSRSARRGAVTLTVRDGPEGSSVREVQWRQAVTGNKPEAVRRRVPIATPQRRRVQLLMKDAVTGEVWQTNTVRDTSALDPLTVCAHYSFYTQERTAAILCTVAVPDRGRMRLEVRDERDRVLDTSATGRREQFLRVPLRGLTPGRHALSVVLRTDTGTALATRRTDITLRPSKPRCETKIDRVQRSVIRHGQPFFPVGIWGVVGHETYFQRMRAAGLNSIIHPTPPADPEWLVRLLKLAHRYDVAVVARPDRFSVPVPLANASSALDANTLAKALSHRDQFGTPFRYDRDTDTLWGRPATFLFRGFGRTVGTKLFTHAITQNLDQILTVVRKAMEHPSLLAYFNFDEPAIPRVDMGVAGRLLYERYNELDGYHPVMTNYNSRVPHVPEASSFVDILCIDAYWRPGGPGLGGGPAYVGYRMHELNERSRRDRKVPWIIIMAERTFSTWKRPVLPAEQRCQTYLALIHGAKGILYFNFPVVTKRMWDTITELANEIKQLEPAIMSPDLSQELSYTPNTYNMDAGELPDVHAVLRRGPDERSVLLAANCRHYPVDATFALPGQLGGQQAVEVLFDERRIATDGDSFSDRFEPYATRAYQFRTAGTAIPVPIHIRTIPHPKPVPPRVERFTGDRKNTVANPSFEQATFPGWPDYYVPGQCYPRFLEETHTLDPVNPYHGRVALRVTPIRHPAMLFAISQGDGDDPYKADRDADYVLSIYMRAERPGRVVRMRAGKRTGNATLTAQWRRYAWTIRLPARIVFTTGNEGAGAIWFDAVQVEVGTEATEFEP